VDKSNLIKIIRTFSSKEIKEFGEFVQSPFFNKNESTVKLYEYIRKEFPSFTDEKIDKQHIYKKLFPGAEYNDGFMRTIIFNLSTLAENFITYNGVKNNHARYGIILLEELNKRKLDKLLLKHLKEAETEVNGMENKNRDYFYYKYLVERIIYSYQNWSRFKKKNLKDYENEGILSETRYLLNYSLGRALANYRFLITKAEHEHVDFHVELLDQIIKFITSKSNDYIKDPSVKLHIYEILLIREKSDKYFKILKKMLHAPSEKITQDEKFSLHNILQTYCTFKVFNGSSGYRRERFELYKASLKGNYYSGTEDLYFDDLLFANIALIGIREEEPGWAENFIKEFESKLAPENKEIIVNYCISRIHFAKKDYENALRILNGIKSIKHVQFKLVIRNLTLMIFYELSLFDTAYSHCDSYRHFLKSSTAWFAQARHERQTNFLKFYYRLTKLKEKPDKKSIAELAYDLKMTSNIIERDWLSEKVKEMA
jgi:hypothetical protein